MIPLETINKSFCFIALLAFTFISCKKEPVILKKQMPEAILDANRLSEEMISLVKDTVYILSANLIRNANQVLIIEAGTLIRVKNNISITIIATGKIVANGTQKDPIIFTSDALKGTAGYTGNFWDGITLDGTNGTSQNNLSYVRIEFAGGLYNASLSLKNMDSTTILNNIQVSYSITTPSFEFFGGNCNAFDLVSFASGNTDFKLSNGYSGRLQKLLAYRHPFFPTTNAQVPELTGMFIQGSNTFPSVSNLSVIGPDLQTGTSDLYNQVPGTFPRYASSLLVSGTAKFHIRNSVLSGFPKGGFYINSPESGISLQFGESDFTYSFVHSNDSSRAFYIPDNLVPSVPTVTAADFKNFMLQPQFHNQLVLNTAEYQFTDPYNYDYDPNPLPKQGSPLLNGANFDGPVFDDPFFQKVNYRGAIGADNWLKEWTNFIPLQTNYNN